jgi:hypothetical protein
MDEATNNNNKGNENEAKGDLMVLDSPKLKIFWLAKLSLQPLKILLLERQRKSRISRTRCTRSAKSCSPNNLSWINMSTQVLQQL